MNPNLRPELRPIWTALTVSIILHSVSLVGVALAYLLQGMIIPLFMSHSPMDREFILPTVSTMVTIVIIFGVHLGLVIGFRNALESGHERLKPLGIATFVFMIVPGILGTIAHFFDRHYYFRYGSERLAMLLSMQSAASFILSLRWAAILILLVAASMAFYYWYVGTLWGDGQQADTFSGDGG